MNKLPACLSVLRRVLCNALPTLLRHVRTFFLAFTDISLCGWSMKTISVSSPSSITDTHFSSYSSSETNARKEKINVQQGSKPGLEVG